MRMNPQGLGIDRTATLVSQMNYGDSIHVVIPWSVLSPRNGRALRSALVGKQLEAGIELGFTISDLRDLTFQDILDARSVGIGTAEKLVPEIQEAINKIHKNPDAHSQKELIWDLLGSRNGTKRISATKSGQLRLIG